MQIDRTWAQVVTDCSEALGDPRNTRFSVPYITRLINEGQFEVVRRTKHLKARAPIISKENQRIYNFPTDILEPVRLENSSGLKIEPAHSDYLQETFGNSFRLRTKGGEATHFYSDNVGQGQFELYPNPTTDFQVDPVEITVGALVGINTPGGTAPLITTEPILAIDADEGRIYVLTKNYYLVYRKVGEKLTRERIVNHAKDLTYDNTYTQPFRVLKNRMTHSDSTIVGSPGTAFFSDLLELWRIDLDDSFTLLETAGENIVHILDFEWHNPTKVYYQTAVDFKIYNTDSFSASTPDLISTETTIIQDSTGNLADRNVYFTLGAGGVKKLVTTTDTVSSELTGGPNIAAGIGAVTTTGNPIYYVDYTDGVIQKLLPADDSITSTTLTVSGSNQTNGSPFACNNLDTIWYWDEDTTSTPLTLNFFQEVVGDAKTRTLFIDDSLDVASPLIRLYAASNEELISASFNKTYLTISTYERGIVTNIDDSAFQQEEGAILDVEDSEEVYNMFQDEGSILRVVNNTSVGYILYIRCPKENVIEVFPHWALIEYVQYRAKKRDGDTRSISEAAAHYSEFLRYVGELQADVAEGFAPGSRGTKLIRF